jgi:hypothetical protein
MPTETHSKFAALVESELGRARTKFPRPQNGFHEGYAVLKEEVDEFWDMVKSDKRKTEEGRVAMLAELVQIAAMAQRTAEDLGLVKTAFGGCCEHADADGKNCPVHREDSVISAAKESVNDLKWEVGENAVGKIYTSLPYRIERIGNRFHSWHDAIKLGYSHDLDEAKRICNDHRNASVP